MSNFEIILGLRKLKESSILLTDEESETIDEAINLAKRQNRLQKLARDTVGAFWLGMWVCFILYTIVLVLYMF